MITYTNVVNKNTFTRRMLESNSIAAFTEPENPPAWYNHSTMARWLFGSSKQFLRDYEEFTEQSGMIHMKDPGLSTILEKFRRDLRTVFQADELLMEETRE